MATFAFSTMVPPQGATFVFGSWVCVSNSQGGFNSYLAEPKELKANSSALLKDDDSISSVEELGEILLPNLVDEIEKMSVSNTTSIRSPTNFGQDSIYSETPHIQVPFGLHNAAASYVSMIHRIMPQRIVETGAPASQEAPIFLTPTRT